MVREFPGFLLVKLLKADKMPRKPHKRYSRIFSLMIHLYRALFA
jgi:hypothetical protein